MRIKDRDRFIAHMAEAQPLKPANILEIIGVNQGRSELTRTSPRPLPVTPGRLEELMSEGHVVVDTRPSAVFGAGHIPGSINVQSASSEFEQRVGWVVPDGTPIVLVAETEAETEQCVYDMAFIGLDASVSGYLAGGIGAWMKEGRPLTTVEQIDVFTAQRRLADGELSFLDVREADEWDEGHIESASSMSYTRMAPQLETPGQLDQLDLGKDERIAVTCAGGFRSSTAISLMLRHGYRNLLNVTGGMEAWGNAHLPMVDATGESCSF